MLSCLLCLFLSMPPATGAGPTISSVDPRGVWAGQGQFTLTVTGTEFRQVSTVVRWDGTPLQTIFESSTVIRATVPASLVALAGSHVITVVNEGAQPVVSNPFAFDVFNPPPTASSISPTTAPVLSALVTVTVNGSNFVPTSVITFNGSARPTTFVSATRLTAPLSVADLATVATGQIQVTSPGPGGGTSTAFPFTVTHPVPAITLLAPSQKTVGDAAFTLTVDGTNFLSGGQSTVLWNGNARSTTFVNATRLTASIPASDLAAAGLANVSVRTTVGASTQTSANAGFSIVAPATGNVPLTPVAPANLPAQVLGPVGGRGGTPFTRDCGTGQVMTGFSYRAGLVVDALVLLCRVVRADGTLGAARAVGDPVGGGGPFTAATCSSETVISRLTVQYGTYVDGVVFMCDPWDPATRRVVPDPNALRVQAFGRPIFTSNRTFQCTEATQPVRGIHGRAASVVDALGISCDEP